MKFEPTMNYNVVITVVSMIAGGGVLYETVVGNQQLSNARIAQLETVTSDLKQDAKETKVLYANDHELLIRIDENLKIIADSLRIGKVRP